MSEYNNSIEETFSPLPPPPPPQEQQDTICIRNILDEYYDAGSFGSNSSSGVAHYMNAADLILEEMNRISPPRNVEGNMRQVQVDNDNIVRSGNLWQDEGDVKKQKDECQQWKRCVQEQQQQNHDRPQANMLQLHPNDRTLQYSINDLNKNECEHHEKSSKPLEMGRESNFNNASQPSFSVQNVSECLNSNFEIEKVSTESTSVDESGGHFASPIPKATDDNDNENKPKRSFLRKGTRKEPSALHRMSKNSLNNSDQNSSVSDSNDKKKSLESLERMQEKQMEDLQKRINRRSEARDNIRKRKQGCKINVTGQSNEETKSHVDEKRLAIDTSTADESFTSETSGDCQSDSDDSSDMSYQAEEKEVIRHKNVLSSPPPKNSSRSTTQPLKSHNRSKGQTKLKQETNDFYTSEIEEQWQLIKSMRRRQEAALRAAEKEREETKAWAAGEKEKLNKWKDQQRSLIQKERQRASNSKMINERKKRQEKLEEQAAEASQMSYRKVKEEIESLKETLKKQKIEADAAKSRHRLSEKRWKDMIAERDKQILSLNEEIQRINRVNNDLAQEKSNLSKKLEQFSQEKKKKKKKKNLISAGEDCQNIKVSSVETDPISGTHVTHVHSDAALGKNDKKHFIANTRNVDESKGEKINTDIFTDEEPSSQESKYSNNESDQNCGNIDSEKDLARIIASHKDLLVDPTEEWLRCHLDDMNKSHGNDCEALDGSVSNFYTPLKERQYDPSKYAPNEEKKEQHYDTSKYVVTEEKKEQQDDHSSKCEDTEKQKIRTKVREDKLPNGTKIATFHNGTVRETLPDGTVIVRFTNGDVKTSYGNIGITVYFYSESKTSHTTHPDGTEIFEFASGQSEKHFPDGSKEIRFPDGTLQKFFAHGGSELTYPNGTRVLEEESGVKHIMQF